MGYIRPVRNIIIIAFLVSINVLTLTYTGLGYHSLVQEDELREKYKYSRILGGGKDDTGLAIDIDSEGRVVITGNTESSDFPVVMAYDPTYNGPTDIYFEGDAFIASFFPNGTLYWNTFFGGSLSDFGSDLVIDSEDNIIITGSTESTDFPVLNGFDPNLNGKEDAFLAKFSSNGVLIWSTFIGDIGSDTGMGVTVDSLDNIFVTGRWEASPIGNYKWDAFIAKYTPNGVLEWLQIVGGSQSDYGLAITIDSQQNLLITGITGSSDFPNDNNYQGTQQEIFVVKLNSSSEIVWSIVIGGSENDFCDSIKVDKENNIIITGRTFSFNYPTLNAFNPMSNGIEDIIVSKFNGNGTMLWSTYLGGSHNDWAGKTYIDDTGNIYITGETFSMDYPLSNTSQSYLLSDTCQAYLTILDSTGYIKWSETFGAIKGSYIWDRGTALTIDSENNVIIVGFTNSRYFPVTTDDRFMGEHEVFVCSLYNPFVERPLMSTSTYSLTTSNTSPESTINLTNGFLIAITLVTLKILTWKKRQKH
ncbi:SBBP repeat-containing protein [Candidatus Hodarchaeum mangrovi]